MRGLFFLGVGTLLAAACGSGAKLGDQGGTTGAGAGLGPGGDSSGSAAGGAFGVGVGGASGYGWTTLDACMNACMAPSDCAPVGSCFVATCAGECCGKTPAAAGTTCSSGDGGTSVCNGSGDCVPACSTPADCPTIGPCYEATCTKGVCGSSVTVGKACSAPINECCNGFCVDVTSDLSNCSACDKVCTTSCEGSVCAPPAVRLDTICGVAVDASYVYWGEFDGGRTTILRSSKSCGERSRSRPRTASG